MSAIAGRVLLIPKGAYNALTTYNPLDFVTYGADSYVCKQTTTGNAPTNTTYWQLMAKGSTDADQIGYDNTGSGLSATDVQAAVDELASEKQDKDLSTPIVVGGVSKTTVEDALSGLNGYTDNISDVISKNGAKNLLPNSITTHVEYGLTFTRNSDGEVTINGTATTNVQVTVCRSFNLEKGTYKLIGIPENITGSYGTIQAFVLDADTSADLGWVDRGADKSISTKTLSANTNVIVYLVIYNGYTVNNLVYKPMITLASQPDSDYAHYVPYAMTNRELTENVTAKEIGSPISIISYNTNANQYTFPSDGYVAVGAGTVDTEVLIQISSPNSPHNIKLSQKYTAGNQGLSVPVFVRKGMQAKCNSGLTETNSAFFYPIS